MFNDIRSWSRESHCLIVCGFVWCSSLRRLVWSKITSLPFLYFLYFPAIGAYCVADWRHRFLSFKMYKVLLCYWHHLTHPCCFNWVQIPRQKCAIMCVSIGSTKIEVSNSCFIILQSKRTALWVKADMQKKRCDLVFFCIVHLDFIPGHRKYLKKEKIKASFGERNPLIL